jgi:hypothetical protein
MNGTASLRDSLIKELSTSYISQSTSSNFTICSYRLQHQSKRALQQTLERHHCGSFGIAWWHPFLSS